MDDRELSLKAEVADLIRRGLTRRDLFVRLAALGVSAAAAGTLIEACSAPSNSTPTSSTKDTLVIAEPETPERLDFETAFSDSATDSHVNINEPLVRMKQIASTHEKGGYEIDYSQALNFESIWEMRLAESIEHSSDWKTFIVHLKHGMPSHAGNELTSDDVVWTYQRSFGLKGVGLNFNQVSRIASPDDVKAVDKYTVQIKSTQPTLQYFTTLTQVYRLIIDSTEAKKHVTPEDPWATAWANTHDLGFGPYMIDEYVPGQKWSYKAFDAYPFDDKPKLKHIIHQVLPEASNRAAVLAKGSVDVAMKLLPEQLESLKGNSDVRIWNFPSLRYSTVVLNASKPPFDNPLIRQAISYAAPYDDVLKNVLRGFGRPLKSMMPDLFPGYVTVSPYATDIAKAKALLAQAGMPNGFTTTFSYQAANPFGEPIGILLQTAMAKVGVVLNLNAMPTTAFTQARGTHTEPMLYYDSAPYTPDPEFAVALNFYSKSIRDWGAYVNATVDALVEGPEVLDAAQRLAAFKNIQSTIMNDAPWLFLAMTGTQMASRKNVTGLDEYCSFTRWKSVSFV